MAGRPLGGHVRGRCVVVLCSLIAYENQPAQSHVHKLATARRGNEKGGMELTQFGGGPERRMKRALVTGVVRDCSVERAAPPTLDAAP